MLTTCRFDLNTINGCLNQALSNFIEEYWLKPKIVSGADNQIRALYDGKYGESWDRIEIM